MKTSNVILTGILIGALILALIPFLFLIGNSTFSAKKSIESNGDWDIEFYDLTDFKDIDIRYAYDVELKQGDFNVEVKAETAVLERLDVKTIDGTLVLSRDDHYSFRNTSTPKVYISMPDLEHVHISGSGKFETDNTFEADDLEIFVSGATDMDLDLDCTTLKTSISGAGKIELSGEADYFSTNNSGAGSIDAEDFVAESVGITINGAGSASVHATKQLDVTVNGAGSVIYAGNPETINKSINGFGSVKSR